MLHGNHWAKADILHVLNQLIKVCGCALINVLGDLNRLKMYVACLDPFFLAQIWVNGKIKKEKYSRSTVFSWASTDGEFALNAALFLAIVVSRRSLVQKESLKRLLHDIWAQKWAERTSLWILSTLNSCHCHMRLYNSSFRKLKTT